MDSVAIAERLFAYGPLGIYAVVVTVAYWRKDQDLQTEKQARIDDTKGFSKTAMDLQSKVIDTTNKLSDVFEELKKQWPPSRTGAGR